MKHTLFGLIAAAAVFLSANCFADTKNIDEPSNWKTECVGRYQVSLPGEVEVALSSSKHLFGYNPDTRFRFKDNSVADFSAGYTVYPKMDISESLVFMNSIKKVFDKNIAERYQKKQAVMDERYTYWMSFSDDENKSDFASVEPGSYSLFIYRDGRYFFFGSSFDKSDNSAKDTEKSVAEVNADINAFRPRPLYTLQNQPGVCIPYGFIADDGTAPRNIGVTMRLIDHPEVEVFFQDGATERDPKVAISLFFDGYVNGEKGIHADFWGYRSITMASQKGKALFVTIERTDDTKDYGYVAYVEGGHDTSSKMLYVIRTASRVKGEPVSKGELKDIAEKIMASVKRHDVQ